MTFDWKDIVMMILLVRVALIVVWVDLLYVIVVGVWVISVYRYFRTNVLVLFGW